MRNFFTSIVFLISTPLASQVGDEFYYEDEEGFESNVAETHIVNTSQTLTYVNLIDHDIEEGSFEINIIATSELPVKISLISGPIELNETTATILNLGTVVIMASQEGNEMYDAVEEEFEFDIVVVKDSQTLTYADLSDHAVEEGSFEISIISSSELPVNISLISGPVELNETTATILDLGTVVIMASQDGNQFYEPAEEEFEFDIVHVLGTKENLLEIKIYPNPTSSFITLSKGLNSKNIQFSLIDLNGKVIQKGMVISAETQLKLQNINAGIYVIRMDDGHRQQSVRIRKN